MCHRLIKRCEARFKRHSSAVNWCVLHGNVAAMLPATLGGEGQMDAATFSSVGVGLARVFELSGGNFCCFVDVLIGT